MCLRGTSSSQMQTCKLKHSFYSKKCPFNYDYQIRKGRIMDFISFPLFAVCSAFCQISRNAKHSIVIRILVHFGDKQEANIILNRILFMNANART